MNTDSDELRQRVSALIDDSIPEHDVAGVIDALERDPSLRETWRRYHLIGEAMRNSRTIVVDRSFADKVRDAIKDEAPIIAARVANRRSDGIDLRQRVVSFALAASLIGIAVIVGRSVNSNADHIGKTSTGVQVSRVDSKANARTDVASEDARFNDYLLMHSESMITAGSAGMLPYARLVSSRVDR